MNRRKFLHAAGGLGFAGMLPGCSSSPVPQPGGAVRAVAVVIPTRLIPRSSEALPLVGLGSTKAVLQIPEKGPDAIRSVIQTLVDNGGRVIDTSFREEAIDAAFGQVLQDSRWKERLFVTTKINTQDGKQGGVAQAEQTERLFNRKPSDLIQVESLRNVDVHLETLREWKAANRTRYIGITAGSTSDFERIEGLMKRDALDFIQVPYSIPESEAEQRVLPAAKDQGIAVLIRSPFMNGEWFSVTMGKPLPRWAAEIECTSWAQVCMKYILANQAVTCVLTETTNPHHMEENMRSSLGKMPDAAMLRRMKSDVQSIV